MLFMLLALHLRGKVGEYRALSKSNLLKSKLHNSLRYNFVLKLATLILIFTKQFLGKNKKIYFWTSAQYLFLRP